MKEFGAYYQAHLATNLRRHGVAVALDEDRGGADHSDPGACS